MKRIAAIAWVGVAWLLAATELRADLERARQLIEAGRHADAVAELTVVLETYPDNPAARFLRARARGYAGDHGAALADYDALVARFPDDVDYRFGRAQVLGWMGRDAEALADLDAAAALAPDYEAVWQLRHQVLRRSGDTQRIEALRAAAARRFPDARWWADEAPAAADDPRLTLTLGGTREHLDNGQPGWDDQFVRTDWRAAGSLTLFAQWARSSRFAASDRSYAAGAEWPFGKGWFAGIQAGGAADALFLPDTAYRAHLGRSLAGGWGIDVALSRREFSTATVSAWSATAEKYFGNYRAACTLTIAHLHGASDSVGYAATLTRYWDETWSLGVTAASGEEAEVVAPGQVLITDVGSVAFTGRYRFSTRVSVSAWLGTHEQGDFYRRAYAGLAVALGF